MAGCKEHHGNPYCSVELPKIRVDMADEQERVARIERDAGISWSWQIQDSQDRIRAVEMGCAVRIGKGARGGKES